MSQDAHLPVPAKSLVGGVCDGCGMAYAVGGPHLVAQHCISALKRSLAKAVEVAVTQSEQLRVLRSACDGAWLVVKRHYPTGQVRIDPTWWSTKPKGAGFALSAEDGDRVLTAVVREVAGH